MRTSDARDVRGLWRSAQYFLDSGCGGARTSLPVRRSTHLLTASRPTSIYHGQARPVKAHVRRAPVRLDGVPAEFNQFSSQPTSQNRRQASARFSSQGPIPTLPRKCRGTAARKLVDHCRGFWYKAAVWRGNFRACLDCPAHRAAVTQPVVQREAPYIASFLLCASHGASNWKPAGRRLTAGTFFGTE